MIRSDHHKRHIEHSSGRSRRSGRANSGHDPGHSDNPDNNNEYAGQTEVSRASESDAPEEFFWQGHRHRVGEVIEHRSETAATTDTDETAETGAVTDDRGVEVWRVRARTGRHGYPGVYDLRFDWAVGRWTVTHIPMEEQQ